MPEMNGYQLASALRLLPGYKNVPEVAVRLSMFMTTAVDDRGFQTPTDKPIDTSALLSLIEQL